MTGRWSFWAFGTSVQRTNASVATCSSHALPGALRSRAWLTTDLHKLPTSISSGLIHNRQQRLAAQIAAQVFGDHFVVALPEFFGESCRVWSDQEIVKVPQGR